MTGMSWNLSLLARMAGVDVVLGDGVDVREPVISSDQFDGSSNAGVAGKWSIMVIPQNVHT